jgi:hypothetical protein
VSRVSKPVQQRGLQAALQPLGVGGRTPEEQRQSAG